MEKQSYIRLSSGLAVIKVCLFAMSSSNSNPSFISSLLITKDNPSAPQTPAEAHKVRRSGFAKLGWIARNTMAQMSWA